MKQPDNQLLHIKRLERRANKIKTNLRKAALRRPIVIEFSGSPKAGKTQSIHSLSVFLRRNEFRVTTIVEQASINPIDNKFDPSFNVWNGCMSLCKLLEVLLKKTEEYDFIILDRGIFDTLCWFRWQANTGKMSVGEYKDFVRFFTNRKWTGLISLVYVFFAQPDKSLEREYSTLLTRKPGRVMRDEVLTGYTKAMSDCILEHGDQFNYISNIDTSEKDQNAVARDVASEVLRVVEDILDEKIGYFYINELPLQLQGTRRFADVGTFFPRVDISSRVFVEAADEFAQLVSIGVVRSDTRDKVIVGRKGPKTLRLGAPEYDKHLFWFGGHVRADDIRAGSLIKDSGLTEILRNTLRRELKEELDIDVVIRGDPLMTIWDQDSDSGRKHLAFVFDVLINIELSKVTVDGKEFEKGGVEAWTFEDYSGRHNIRTDKWSNIILEDVLKWQTGPLFEQVEFRFR